MKKKNIRNKILLFLLIFPVSSMANDVPILANAYARNVISLDGKWNYIIDPLENGYYDYRMQPYEKNGFFENKKAKNPQELVEYNFDTSPLMDIPSDWNTKNTQLFFYEGTIWFKKDFTFHKSTDTRTILYFGAVNYDAKIYLNGKKVGEHIGGFTPFNFDITNEIKEGNNFLILKVDNKRQKEGVPTLNMDWWNYGGITRDVMLITVPEIYIEDYAVQYKTDKNGTIFGWIKLNKPLSDQNLFFEIPELKIKQSLTTNEEGIVNFEIKSHPKLWSPTSPKLYEVKFSTDRETFSDQIGFRTIETKGKEIFLKGISIHEEAPFRQGRAWSKEDAKILIDWAKELGCNYVRLAHYPHNENMVREAERAGLMVWSEIPVYWTISWGNSETYKNAERQLHDMIYRDKNRCAVIIWSIANETPQSIERDLFLSNLSKYAKSQDSTRLISMAMEVTSSNDNVYTVKDNMNQYVDIISFNEYMGWYNGTPDLCRLVKWEIPYNKPVIISEFGGGALPGLYGDKSERWTEEYQEELYLKNLEMLEKIDGLAGISPWILVDFYSPRRQLYGIQDFFNRKGLISNNGIKKKAFYILQEWYKKIDEKYK